MAFMVALYIGGKHGRLGIFSGVSQWVDIGGLFGTHSAIMTAGIIAGSLVKEDAKDCLRNLVLLGLGLYLAGELIRPLHGVSKIGGTDAYALVSSGICCLAFAAFHFALKRPGRPIWSSALIPSGKNPLMAYLLPDAVNAILGMLGIWGWAWPLWHQGGAAGLANALAVTGVLMAMVAWLNRRGLFLRI
jgi:predicted acyltransferase